MGVWKVLNLDSCGNGLSLVFWKFELDSWLNLLEFNWLFEFETWFFNFFVEEFDLLFISVKKTSFLVSYSVNYFWAVSFNESADSTRLSLSPSRENLGRIVLRASLGSFLALTVLMRSGRSSDLSFFMVWMKFLCWTSLKMVKALLSSSMVLTTSELDLVNLSQST